MPVTSIGDMSQQFLSLRNGGAIKSDLNRLSSELSSGRIRDIPKALGGDTTRLSAIQHSLGLADAYRRAATETGHLLQNIQTVLDHVDGTRQTASSAFLAINDDSNAAQIDNAAHAAENYFDDIVTTLNGRLADRSLMAGTAVNVTALDPNMLDDLILAIGPRTDATDIGAAIDTWFDDPAGGFATTAYRGDNGAPVEKRVAENKHIQIDARADQQGIKDVLKGAAFAAVVDRLGGLDQPTKATLLQEAGAQLFASSTGLIAVQASVGFAQETVAQAQAEMSAQRAALNIAQNDFTAADPFETASRLQAVQLQLETHYAVTARLSQLSLLDYIR